MDEIHAYLESPEAEQDVALLLSDCPSGFLRVGHGTWNLGQEGAWRTALYHHNETGADPVVYFRPDGDILTIPANTLKAGETYNLNSFRRYVVTDLGEAVRALRLRTRWAADFGAARGPLKDDLHEASYVPLSETARVGWTSADR